MTFIASAYRNIFEFGDGDRSGEHDRDRKTFDRVRQYYHIVKHVIQYELLSVKKE